MEVQKRELVKSNKQLEGDNKALVASLKEQRNQLSRSEEHMSAQISSEQEVNASLQLERERAINNAFIKLINGQSVELLSRKLEPGKCEELSNPAPTEENGSST